MYKGKTILGIIPARAGSKGIPGKNIKMIADEPLICWTIKNALKSLLIDKVIVSTDGDDIANISEQCGAEVPFFRPKELAADTSPTSDVVIHALHHFSEKGHKYDCVAILEPTSPLRKKDDIDRGIKTFIDFGEADSLVTLGEVHTEHPVIVKKVINNMVCPYMHDAAKIYQRQQADKAYFPYGVLYLSKSEEFQKQKTFYTNKTLPLFIERWQNYEIDDEIDFLLVEKLIHLYKKQMV